MRVIGEERGITVYTGTGEREERSYSRSTVLKEMECKG